MRAIAVVPGTRRIELRDVESPRIASPTDVKLRVLDVGICGTDREISAFQYGTPPPGSEYLVIGHESLGQVIEVGAAVSRVRPGDLVVPMVRRPCPHDDCVACRAGRQDFCYTGDFTERGIKQRHVFGTVNASAEAFEAAIRDLAVFKELWPGALDALITGRFPLDAHRDLLLGPARGIKNVLRVADAAS